MESSDGVAPENAASDALAVAFPSSEVVIGDYMERLGTRLGILETELKYAWRALDLLSQEYVKMWERLEKLEVLLCEQQTVITQLLDFYSTEESQPPKQAELNAVEKLGTGGGNISEIDALQHVLNLAEGGGYGLSEEATEIIKELQLEDMLYLPDEAFYRSLNKAYREDLVGFDVNVAAGPPLNSSQLGMIWEEVEETEENGNGDKNTSRVNIEEENIFSSLDYKDYKSNVACVTQEDMERFSCLSAVDKEAFEKLDELDRLTSKLQKDSIDLRQLQDQLLEPVQHQSASMDHDLRGSDVIQDQLRDFYSDAELENWNFGSSSRGLSEMLLLAGLTSSPGFQNASLTQELPHTPSLRNQIPEESSLNPFTCLSTSPKKGDNEYSSLTNISNSPKRTELSSYSYSPSPKHGVDSKSYSPAQYSSIACTSPSMYSMSSGKLSSSPVSVISVRVRQDPYMSEATKVEINDTSSPSPSSPPPPAPDDRVDFSITLDSNSSGYYGVSSSFINVPIDSKQGRLTPHSPKSPRTSPKRTIKSSSSMVPAKSDSGLSSMSGGWSSLEKSPGSPKHLKSHTSPDTGILLGRVQCHTHSRSYSTSQLNASPKHRPKSPFRQESDPYSYTHSSLNIPGSSNTLLPGGTSLSAFTVVKTPTGPDSSSTSATSDCLAPFVPSPAPSSDISINSSRRSHHVDIPEYYHPAIYSVAGSHRQPYTSVYTNGSSYYGHTMVASEYPDVVSHYPISDTSSSSSQYMAGSEQGTSRSHSTSTSVYPTPTTTPTQYSGGRSRGPNISQMDCYKTAMYRTMFPTGQITDAMSYYPPPQQWMSRSDDYTGRIDVPYSQDVSRTKPSLMDPSAQYKAEEGYPIPDKKWNRRDWNSELDIREQESEDTNQYNSGVIVSQSGYISFSSDMATTMASDSRTQHKSNKKVRRGGSLKSSVTSAMSSVSQWLPDLHISKRHRSNSLPGNELPDEQHTKPKVSMKGKLQKQMTIAKRKGQKLASNINMNTVSGILQKVKKKRIHSQSQSLSDPEPSDYEWGVGSRSSTMSAGSQDSVFDEVDFLFPKVSSIKVEDTEGIDITAEKLPELDLPLDDISDEHSTTGSNLFPTIGEVKQTTAKGGTSSDESVASDGTIKFPQVNIGSASREFAVSRALGKYRQRQNSTVSDDPAAQEDGNVSGNSGSGKENVDITPDDNVLVSITERIQEVELKEESIISSFEYNHSAESAEDVPKPPVIFAELASSPPQPPPASLQVQQVPQPNFASNEEPTPPMQSSPSLQSVRSQRYPYNRHQQSLDVSWGMKSSAEGDEDTRSTYSWRSTSRVSSRRQSTEDSIDSEDEWYCYELKKLEELERQHHLDFELVDKYKPDDNAKQQMTLVLKELQLKASQSNLLDDSPVTTRVHGIMRDEISNSKRRMSMERRKLPEMPEFRPTLERRMSRELPTRPNEIIQPKETLKIDSEDDKDPSSGDTSGPDSPHQSDLDYEDCEGPHSDSHSVDFPKVSFKEEEVEQVLPIELSSGTEKVLSTELGSEYINELIESVDGELLEGMEDSQVQIIITDAKDGKEGGPGSKWKLLKALKERKAEEKEAKAEAAAKTEEPAPVVS